MLVVALDAQISAKHQHEHDYRDDVVLAHDGWRRSLMRSSPEMMVLRLVALHLWSLHLWPHSLLHWLRIMAMDVARPVAALIYGE